MLFVLGIFNKKELIMACVFFYFDDNDKEADKIIKCRKEFLTENSKEYKLKGGYSVRCDTNNPPPTQDHLHIMKKGNQFVCMNKDGSVHDGVSGRIPASIIQNLQDLFPGYAFPSDRIVECVEQYRLNRLIESIQSKDICFDDLIDEAIKLIIYKSNT